MRVFDVTLPMYHAMPVYEGDPGVSIEPWLSISQGAPANVTRLGMGSHTGTHVDAPAHFRDGAPGVDQLPLDVLMGPARVYDLAVSDHIGAASLRGIDLTSSPRILFKTRNSSQWREGRFRRDFVGLMEDAARLLVDSGVRLVGVDSLSVEPFGAAGFPTHRTLLDAGVIIVEGLDLSAVPPGDYELLCLPLKLQQGDGAPARVVLREMTGDREPHRPGHGSRHSDPPGVA
ncbi:MAG: cyclase family protein [candidate division NC10 bacterium]